MEEWTHRSLSTPPVCVHLCGADSSSANEDTLPVFFAVVNVGTRDGAAISAIHPAMQLPVVMHLPPTVARGAASAKPNRGSSEGKLSLENAHFKATSSLKAAQHRIAAADFFARALGDDVEEDKQLHELLLHQQKAGIHGKLHFLSLPQDHKLLLQKRKNEAPVEQRLLHWANARTNR